MQNVPAENQQLLFLFAFQSEMQEMSVPTCASFSLHQSLSIFPFLAASLHSHTCSLNAMLSGFFASWCLCLAHEFWFKTNMGVCVCVRVKEQRLLLTGSVKTFCSGLLPLRLC